MPSHSSGKGPLPPPRSEASSPVEGAPGPSAEAAEAAPPPSSSTPPTEDEEIKAQQWEIKVREAQQDFVDFPRWRRFRTQLPSICDVLLNGWCSCQQRNNGVCENNYELHLLKMMNIGFSLFGSPVKEGNDENSIEGMGYNDDQLKVIKDIFNVIMKHRRNLTSSEVLFAPVFIFVRSVCGQELTVPVFRIPDPGTNEYPPEKYWFIDHSCRTYCNWDDYLNSNQLPKGRFCYPENGVYPGDSTGQNKQVKSFIAETPASSVYKAVTSGMDTGATVASVGVSVISLIGFFTPLGAVVGTGCAIGAGVSGGYSLVRSSMNLADRGNHGQSIGLGDRSSRRNWMGIAGSLLGFGAVGGAATVASLAEKGRVVSKIGARIVDGLNVSSAFVNGACIVDEIVDLATRDRDDVSAVECVQVAVSLVFFCHSVVSMKSALTMIEETRTQVIENHRKSLRSNRHRKMFNGVMRETMKGQSKAAGEAQVIRGIKHISNVDEAYAKILRSKKACKADGIKFSFGDSGLEKNTAKRVPSKSTSWRSASGCGTSEARFKTSFVPPKPHISLRTEGGSSPYISGLIDELIEFLTDLLKNHAVVRSIMKELKDFCDRIPYGKAIYKCISLVVEYRNCQTATDYVSWVFIFLKELKSVFEYGLEMFLNRPNRGDDGSENPSSFVPKGKEKEILKEAIDKALCTSLIHAGHENADESNSIMLREEESYHFPEHLKWGAQGDLGVEWYKRIAENTLGARIEGTENIYCTENTALVPVQGKGVVEITSHVQHRTVIVTKFTFPEDKC